MNSPTIFWVVTACLLGSPLSWGQADRLLEPARHPEPNPSGEEVSTTTPSETKAEEDLDGIPVYSPKEGEESGGLPAYQPYSGGGADGLPDGGVNGLPDGSNELSAKPGAQQEGIQSEAESLIVEGKKALGSLSSDPAGTSPKPLLGPVETFAAPEEPEEAVLSFGAGGGKLNFENEPLVSGVETLGQEEESISVDFPDEDIRTIIRNVADLYDLNLVVPQSLVGRASIKLRNVTWRQVLDVVLEPIGYTYVEDGNILKIKSQEELKREPVNTQIFSVDYANAAELKDAIMPLIATDVGGKIQVDKRTNSLVITERPSKMGEIRQIIERLDRQTEQVLISTNFIEIRDQDAQKLGIDWTSMGDYALSLNNMGMTWDFLSARNEPDENSFIGTGVFSPADFQVVLRALNTLDDVKLVSKPNVVTLNNHEAKIAVSQRYPLPEFEFNELTGSFEISGFEYIDIGVILTVTPQVNTAGFINLNILPEVSRQNDSVTFGGATSTEIPIITSRRTQSIVTLKDGYTIALGGLIEEELQNTDTQIPLLGRIPLVGWLFKSRVKSVDKNNLVIFVTARTLSPEGATYKDMVDPRQLKDMKLMPSEIVGYDIPEKQREQMKEVNRLQQEAATIQAELALEAQVQALKGGGASSPAVSERKTALKRSGPRRS